MCPKETTCLPGWTIAWMNCYFIESFLEWLFWTVTLLEFFDWTLTLLFGPRNIHQQLYFAGKFLWNSGGTKSGCSFSVHPNLDNVGKKYGSWNYMKLTFYYESQPIGYRRSFTLRTKWELEGVWGRGGADIGAPKSLILLVRVGQMDVLQPFVPLGNSATVPRGQKLESPLVCLRGGGKWWVLQSFYTVIFQQKGSACGGMVACDKISEYGILGVGVGGC